MDAGGTGSDQELQLLRAKYHDYCSAQIADLLLYLSPDEIYMLAQRAHREAGGQGELTYAQMVRVATEWLARRITLPPFEVWRRDYEAHPERYDEYLMGLWETEEAESGS